MDIQEWVFGKVTEKIPSAKKLATVISETLDLSLNNAYKRIRADVKLSAEELIKILVAYDIQLDEYDVFSKSQSRLSAIRPTYIEDTDSLTIYLNETYRMLSLSLSMDHLLYYSARDLPLFCYFFSDNLIRFKHLVWLRGANYSAHSELRLKDISIHIVRQSRNLFDLYRQMNVLELWTERTMSNVLNQMNSLVAESILNKEEALLILQDLIDLIDLLRRDCVKDSQHQMYKMPYLNMSNNALLISENINLVFLSFAGINYLRTSNANMVADLKKAFNQQILSGICMNDHIPTRDAYFRVQETELDHFRKKWSS
jgi:hypothetical protein